MSLTGGERVRDIADSARRSAPEDWQKIVLHAEALANSVEVGFIVTLTDGTLTKKVRSEDDLGLQIAELRSEMHDAARGTWFLADFTIEGTEVTADFDYDTCPFGGLVDDDDPDIEADADPELVLKDHQMYPRPADQLPHWHPALA